MSFYIETSDGAIDMSDSMFYKNFFEMNENEVPLTNLPPLPNDFNPNVLINSGSSNQLSETINKPFSVISQNTPLPSPIYPSNFTPLLLNSFSDSNAVNEKRGVKRKELESPTPTEQPFKRIKIKQTEEERRELNKISSFKNREYKKEKFNNLIDQKIASLSQLEVLKGEVCEFSGKCRLFFQLLNSHFVYIEKEKQTKWAYLAKEVDNLMQHLGEKIIITSLADLEKQKKFQFRDRKHNSSSERSNPKEIAKLASQAYRQRKMAYEKSLVNEIEKINLLNDKIKMIYTNMQTLFHLAEKDLFGIKK